MEKAKQAIKDFTSKAGHHDTTVHEKVAPAIAHETVTPTRHENVTTAIDKEIHQDHYHTSVQPVHDKKVAPEQHSHQMAAVEQRTFDHGNSREDESRIAREAGQFKDKRTVTDTEHTHSINPSIAGEHVHHHVHETIQPVVQREVVQPSVVHTTVPVHEVHHNAAQHHSSSALPPVSMSDFKKQGGVLGGREERTDGFEGEPKSVGGALGGDTTGHHSHHSHQGHHNTTGMSGTSGTGLTGTSDTRGSTGTGLTGTSRTHDTTGTGLTGTSDTRGSTGTGLTGTSRTHDTTDTKPSLGDKINPKTDADRDGKRGILD